jgi:hypothetical protein
MRTGHDMMGFPTFLIWSGFTSLQGGGTPRRINAEPLGIINYQTQ